MKNLKYISPLPFLFFLFIMFLPFVEHRTSWNGIRMWTQRGIDFKMVLLPLGIMLLILLIANIKRTRFTAIVSFVLCFGLIMSLFLMQFSMMPASSYTIHSIRIGYPMAFFSVLLLMVILLINLVKTFLSAR